MTNENESGAPSPFDRMAVALEKILGGNNTLRVPFIANALEAVAAELEDVREALVEAEDEAAQETALRRHRDAALEAWRAWARVVLDSDPGDDETRRTSLVKRIAEAGRNDEQRRLIIEHDVAVGELVKAQDHLLRKLESANDLAGAIAAQRDEALRAMDAWVEWARGMTGLATEGAAGLRSAVEMELEALREGPPPRGLDTAWKAIVVAWRDWAESILGEAGTTTDEQMQESIAAALDIARGEATEADYLDRAALALAGEVRALSREWGPFASPHEAWAVIREELDELWVEVLKKREARSNVTMRDEALDIARAALRFAAECDRAAGDEK